MNCRDVFREISNYVDGDLDAELKRAIEAHACGCHHCEVVVDTTRKTIELYCDGRLFAIPLHVRQRLHATLRQKCQGKLS
ncbi:MAG TPA: zf-HC2 domain-containing protein [Terriglobia bacterium]